MRICGYYFKVMHYLQTKLSHTFKRIGEKCYLMCKAAMAFISFI